VLPERERGGYAFHAVLACCWCIALAMAAVGCSSDDEPDPPGDGSDPPVEDAGPVGCLPGELAIDTGCRAAGIAPDACAEGFDPSGDGSCVPVLPDRSCADGTMAVPGEAACRVVAGCERGTWGGIPIEVDTQHVDATYAGSDADGSAAKPWATIGDAVNAAADGALIAIAAGKYTEDVVLAGKPVRLWGRCPEQVEIEGVGVENGAVSIGPGADGSEVHSVAIRGALDGVFVDGAEGVLVDRVWIHDTGDRGVGAQGTLGPTRLSVTNSLVERAYGGGVIAIGVPIELQASVVRETRVRSDGTGGRGIHVFANPNDGARGVLDLRASVIEENIDVAVRVAGSDATIDASVLRDTAPTESGSYGSGLYVIADPDTRQPALATVRGSVIDRNHHVGVIVDTGSEALFETTVVRDTRGHVEDGVAGADGLGVNVRAATLTMRSCVVENNRKIGVFVSGSKATLHGVLVRDTSPQESDGMNGRGVNVQVDPESGARASLELLGSVIERSREMGLFVAGCDTLIDATRISDTAPQLADMRFGRGIDAQHGFGQAATLTVRGSRVERSHDVGVFISVPGAVLEGTTVAETASQASDGGYGDGVGVFGVPGPASALVRDCRIEHSARAGVAAFGAEVTLAATALDCNPIALDGEPFGGAEAKLLDEGGNVCGCDGHLETCRLQSAGLSPPDAGDVVSEKQ
jgi:hypothetical protein